MILLFTGVPGSGKSLHAAKMIRDHLKWRRCPVICNFDVNPDLKGYKAHFTYRPNERLTPDFLRDFAAQYWQKSQPREDEILLVVDEAQLLFNTREWSRNDRMDWVEFLSQHRHFGYCVVFMTQIDRMLDRQIRALAEYEFQHRKISSFGFKGSIVKALCLGHEAFVCVQTYHGMGRLKLGQQFFIGTKSLYKVYDSYSAFRRIEDTPEDGATGSPPEGVPDVRRLALQVVGA